MDYDLQKVINQRDDYKIANAELEKENEALLKFKEIQEKELLELKEKIKAYQEDRFCQGGCAIYQYDKIHKLTQALDSIENICRNVLDDDYIRNLAFALLDIINKAREQE